MAYSTRHNFPCGCYTYPMMYAEKADIQFCDMHKAAPALLKALEAVLARAHAQGDTITQDIAGGALAEIPITTWKRTWAKGQEVHNG